MTRETFEALHDVKERLRNLQLNDWDHAKYLALQAAINIVDEEIESRLKIFRSYVKPEGRIE